jgi:hypothetical protein
MAETKKRKEKSIRRTTKGKGANYRPTKSGAGMTAKGVKAYKAKNPGSKLKTAVTGKVKKGSAAAVILFGKRLIKLLTLRLKK